MKDQIKMRMEDLLQQEIESCKTRSTCKSLQSSVSTALTGTAVAGREEEDRGGVGEETEAELMFHMDSGT